MKPAALQRGQAGVEAAVGDRPQRAEHALEPLAQLVAVQRRLMQQAEHGELEHAGLSAHVLGLQ